MEMTSPHSVTVRPAAVVVLVTLAVTVLQKSAKVMRNSTFTDVCVVAVTKNVCAGRVYPLVTVVVVFELTVAVLGSFK